MPHKIAKKKAAAKAKKKPSVKPTSPLLKNIKADSKSSADETTIRNPRGLTLKPTNPKSLYKCARGPINLERPSPPRRVPNGMHPFIDYYQMLRIHRNASHMTVSRQWELLAVKEFDPLIEHVAPDMELNDFLMWHDVHEWLLVDEYTRTFYNSRLEQYERMFAAGVDDCGRYHEAFFPYDSEEEDDQRKSPYGRRHVSTDSGSASR